jgi:hypothetical protein
LRSEESKRCQVLSLKEQENGATVDVLVFIAMDADSTKRRASLKRSRVAIDFPHGRTSAKKQTVAKPDNAQCSYVPVFDEPNQHLKALSSQNFCSMRKPSSPSSLSRTKNNASCHHMENAHDRKWALSFEKLSEYKSRHGDTLVPKDYISGGVPLGNWVRRQRYLQTAKLKGSKTPLTQSRIEKLNSLGFDWDTVSKRVFVRWEENFERLIKYKETHGDTRVPSNYRIDDVNLGNWVRSQRAAYSMKTRGKSVVMNDERIYKLNSIGFQWDLQSRLSGCCIGGFTELPSLVDQTIKELEVLFLQNLDREILTAEEVHFMEKLEKAIIIEEEKSLLQRIDEEVTKAEVCFLDETPRVPKRTVTRVGRSSELTNGSHSSAIQNDSQLHTAMAVDSATLYFPKHLKGNKLISREEFNSELLLAFKKECTELLDGFTTSMQVCQAQSDTWKLTVQGQPEALQKLSQILKGWIHNKINAFNYLFLVSEGTEVEVQMKCTAQIEAKLVETAWNTNGVKKQGLLIQALSSKGQLGKALGEQGTSCGAAVISIEKQECSSIAQFKDLVKNTGVNNASYKLQLMLHPESFQVVEHEGGMMNTAESHYGIVENFKFVNQDTPSGSRRKAICPSTASGTSGSYERKEYVFKFPSGEKLGFYCKNDRSGKSPVCRICSVCPNSITAKDSRVLRGTIVVWASVGNGDRCAVSKWQDLAILYTQASQGPADLNIWFVNRHEGKFDHDGSRLLDSKDWTDTGIWRGKEKAGWAGGDQTHCCENLDPRSGTDRDANSSLRPVALACRQEELESSEDEQWFLLDHMPSIREHVRLHPALKKAGSAKKGKTISFDRKLCQVRKFVRDSRTCEFYVQRTFQASPVAPPSYTIQVGSSTSFECKILQAIKKHSFKELIQVLQNGAFAANRSVAFLDTARRELRLAVESMKLENSEYCGNPRNSLVRRRDLDLKHTVLKVYISAAHTYSHARGLRNWSRFELLVKSIENLRLSPSLLRGQGESFISAKLSAIFPDSSSSEQLAPLPRRPFSNLVEYGNEFSSSYFLNHNASIAAGRCLVIDIQMNPSEASGAFRLGSMNVEVAELQANCPRDGSWWNVSKQILAGPHLEDGVVHINARRVAVDPEYIKAKRRDGCIRLKTTCDWACKFNDSLSPIERAGGVLDLHVPVFGGASLLHTAILLQDSHLVRKLLDLGLDPGTKSQIGSPMSLAFNLIENVTHASKNNGMSGGETYHNHAEPGDRAENDRAAALARISKMLSSRNEQSNIRRDGAGLLQREGASLGLPSSTHSTISVSTLTPKLPTLPDTNWLLEPTFVRHICRYNEGATCRLGQRCAFIHIKASLGENLVSTLARMQKSGAEDEGSLQYFRKNLKVISRQDSSNCIWYTAGFSTVARFRTSNQQIFYAEGGPGVLSQQGVTWYRDRKSAVESLARVFKIFSESTRVKNQES